MEIREVTSRSMAFGLYQGEQLVGGLLAKVARETAHVSLLAIAENLRGQDWGTKLMAQGEEAFKALGMKNITLTTLNYQAKGFYEKQGYQLVGELTDVPQVGMTRYYFIKRLG